MLGLNGLSANVQDPPAPPHPAPYSRPQQTLLCRHHWELQLRSDLPALFSMSGFQDVRDVMDITGPVEALPRPPPVKKQKTVEKRPGLSPPNPFRPSDLC
jgi:hypothetical protein